MIFITTYKIKPFLSTEETKKLLEVSAKAGAGPGGRGALRGGRRQPSRGDRRN
jgi:hypothetical protein